MSFILNMTSFQSKKKIIIIIEFVYVNKIINKVDIDAGDVICFTTHLVPQSSFKNYYYRSPFYLRNMCHTAHELR